VRDDVELHAEVYRLVDMVVTAVRADHRTVPGVDTSAWWNAPAVAKIAGVLVLGEAWCLHDPERAVRQRLQEMSYDLSAGHDWAAASRRPTLATLDDRRAVPGPGVRSFDAAAAARWVATGSSAEGEGAA